MEVEKALIPHNDPFYERQGIGLYRKWFREAVDRSKK